MTTVVCLSVGDAFPPTYVYRLYSSIKRNTTKYFDFVCICDGANASKIRDRMPFGTCELYLISPEEYPKWWGKFNLFKPEFQEWIDDDIIFFDLDTIITGPMDDILEAKNDQTGFIILRNFLQPPVRNPHAKTICELGSAVMYVGRRNKLKILHGEYLSQVKQERIPQWDKDGGDQKLIEACIEYGGATFWEYDSRKIPENYSKIGALNSSYHRAPLFGIWQDMFPNRFYSSKYPVRLHDVPQGASVICYHGNPRPHDDQTNPIVANHWR